MNLTVSGPAVTAPSWRQSASWLRAADVSAALMALALPWSTSLASIFAVAWLVTLAPTLRVAPLVQVLRRPEGALPVALFALAAIGTLWATDIPWADRLHGINPPAKLLAIPLLIYHFQRSAHGVWVFVAFLASCTVLMLASWLTWFVPSLLPPTAPQPGVPVKNYIDQSQALALCAFAVAWPALDLFRRGRRAIAWLLVALAVAILANMAFAVTARTALVYMPVMLVVFAMLHLRRRDVVLVIAAAVAIAGIAWLASPNLRQKTESIISEYDSYRTGSAVTSVGLRLEFWRKSLIFFREAPLIGHGTGATRTLFVRAAEGQTGVSAEVIANPHNQTLNVAVQWGIVGVAVLFAMWFAHLTLFRGTGLAAWVGLLVVVQNMVSSLANSHLFDFVPGWIYVLGVGVAGGMVLGARAQDAAMDGQRRRDREVIGS